MSQLILDISVSLDGYVAGPEPTLDEPLGRGGELLHEWAFATRTFRQMHDMEGGETGPDDELAAELVGRAGATIMGRRMFSGGEGPWEGDPRADGWWGADPPFGHPVFVLTHHEREPLVMRGTTFTFVTDGIESALEQARAAAGERDVAVGGGGSAAAQYLRAGLLDEVRLHVVPVLLGDGVRLFRDHWAGAPGALRCTRVERSPTGVAHLAYRVPR